MLDNVNEHILPHDRLVELSQTHGDSFFVLNGQQFADNFTALLDAFSAHYKNVRIGYSYKTNYTPQLCKIAHSLGGYAEVVSEMEYALAKRLDIPTDRIIFNGPVKARWAFEEVAIGGGILNLDSMRDIAMLRECALSNPNVNISAVLRTNFAIGNDVSRFGMDVDGHEFSLALTTIAALENVKLKGLHCHFPDRDLESFERRANGMVTLIRGLFPDEPPEIINIGGGYFSNMPASLRAKFDVMPATFDDYGKVVGTILTKAFEGQRAPLLFLEPGTAIVADTQKFYTRILSIKNVRGVNFATVAGSGFDISPTARSRNLPVIPVLTEHRDGGEPHDVVGFTCIEKDILSEGLIAPLKVGDFLCYSNVGSYSVVMRPPFILPSNPILFDKGDGSLALIKRRQSNEDIFREFIS